MVIGQRLQRLEGVLDTDDATSIALALVWQGTHEHGTGSGLGNIAEEFVGIEPLTFDRQKEIPFPDLAGVGLDATDEGGRNPLDQGTINPLGNLEQGKRSHATTPSAFLEMNPAATLRSSKSWRTPLISW